MKNFKKLSLFLWVVLLFSLSCGTKKDNNNIKPFDEDAAKTVSAVTSGTISSTDNIVVRFVNSVVDNNLVGTNVVVPVLNFEPEIDGISVWKDSKTLVFTPSSPLKLTSKYKGKLLLKKLFPADKNLKNDEIEFSFQVASREVVSIKGDFIPDNVGTPKNVIFTGSILLTEPSDINSIKKSVQIFLDNKTVKPVFSFREDLKQFSFTVKGIVREKKHTVKVKINGEKLGISSDMDKDFDIFSYKRLTVADIKKKSKGSSLYFTVKFSDELDKGQNLDGLISVVPKVKLNIKKSGKNIIVRGNFKNGASYNVTVHKGIRGKWGNRLDDDYSSSFYFLDLKPEIQFVTDGVFLPGSNNRKIQFYSVNLKQVYLTITKVFESNIGIFLQDENLDGASTRTNSFYSKNSVGVEVVKRKELLLGEEKNIKKLNELDLSKLIAKDARGMFLIKLNFEFEDMLYSHPFPDRYDDYYDDPRARGYIYDHGKVYKPVLLSNLGIVCKKADNNFKIFVTDIETGKPKAGIDVFLKTYQNQVAAKSATNSEGIATFNNIKDKIFIVESTVGDERSIVKLDDMRMNLSSFDTEGARINKEGQKAFIYTERGVYRPGDNVNISIIVRNEENTFPENHPITVKISNPKRQNVLTKVLKTGVDGFYSFKFKTEENDPTGNYQVSVKAGDKTFNHLLKIETVVPYKLKIKIDSEKKIVTSKDKTVNLTIDTKYLFGNPAANLKVEIRGSLKKYPKRLKNYRNYSFTDESVNFKEVSTLLLKGNLGNDGIVNFNWTLPSLEFAPSSLMASIEAIVFEKGGRANKQKINIPVEPFEYYVGVEKPVTDYGMVKAGTTLNLNSVVINSKGEAVGGKPLTYKLYRNNLYWWWEYRYGTSKALKYKSDIDTELVFEGELVSSSVPVPISLNIKDSGEYFLEVQSGGKHKSGFFFSAGYWGSGGKAKDGGIVKLKTDKLKYTPGDKAKITFLAPKQGSILVSVEKGFEIKKMFVVNSEKAGETTIEIPITKDMIPNAYISVSVVQGRKGIENDRPLRMFGVVPIMVEDKLTRQNIEINMADSLESEKPFKIKIQTKDKKKTQFTIAVVDEGLLALTAFKTPNPYKHFYSKERLEVITSDMFNYVIGTNKGDIFNLFSIGGGMMAKSVKNDKSGKKRRFIPVCMFKGPLTTDSSGFAEVEFKMPNYIGAVRVMIVSADNNRYGQVEKTVPVKKDLMILPTLPRVLHSGDKFQLPVTVFAMKDGIGEVNVSLKLGNNLNIEGNLNKLVKFEKADEKDVMFKLNVDDFIGTTKVTVKAKSSSLTAAKTFNLTVVPVAPRMYKSNTNQLKPGNKLTLNIPKDGIKGSNEAFVSIMSRPNLNLEHRISRLIRYPYGCVEQTTSAVFPQLFLDQMVELTDTEKEKISHAVNKAINRLKRFVTPSGGFSYWPGGINASMWGTSYAGHFLIEAKKQGFYVPDTMLNSFVKFQSSMALTTKDDLKTRVYRVYLLALAGYPSSGGMNLLKESSLKDMNNVEKWMLAAAYQLSGDKGTANRILLSATTDVKTGYYVGNSFGSALRDLSIILDTAVILEKNEVALKLVSCF